MLLHPLRKLAGARPAFSSSITATRPGGDDKVCALILRSARTFNISFLPEPNQTHWASVIPAFQDVQQVRIWERGCFPTTIREQLRRPCRPRHPCAVPRTSLQCVCTPRRNCIAQLSTSRRICASNRQFSSPEVKRFAAIGLWTTLRLWNTVPPSPPGQWQLPVTESVALPPI